MRPDRINLILFAECAPVRSKRLRNLLGQRLSRKVNSGNHRCYRRSVSTERWPSHEPARSAAAGDLHSSEQVLRARAAATRRATTSAQILHNIQADPDRLRDMAEVLDAHAPDSAQSAAGQGVGRAGPLVSDLDQVCKRCHLNYWYPAQKAKVSTIEQRAAAQAAERPAAL